MKQRTDNTDTVDTAPLHCPISPNLLRYLPWVEVDSHHAVWLRDGSVGAVYELSPLSIDACDHQTIAGFRDTLQRLLQNVFPLYSHKESPWIVQCYVEKTPSLLSLHQAIAQYIPATWRKSRYATDFLALVRAHGDWLTRPGGVFVDHKVSGHHYRGGISTVRLVFYRKTTALLRRQASHTLLQALAAVCLRFEATCQEMSMIAKRYNACQFTDWLLRWFNPAPKITHGNVNALIALTQHQEHKPTNDHTISTGLFGRDMTEELFFAVPRSNQSLGYWYFDNIPHRYVAIQSLRQVPALAHISGERRFGQHQYALLDKLSEGSVFVMTTVMQSQTAINNHLEVMEKNAQKTDSMAAAITVEDCQIAKAALERGNYLFPVSLGVYLRGSDEQDLQTKLLDTEALLVGQGFHVCHRDHDLMPLHGYLNQLPLCYDHGQDQRHFYRSGYVFAKQIANLLPLYGRSRGTGNPCITLFNRGGEPLTFDPLSPKDKDNNSYLLLLGAAGSGKSSTSVYLLMQVMAVYCPRLVIVDAGNSFGLLVDYFAEQGLSVHRVSIDLANPPILNPFANAKCMLQQLESLESTESPVQRLSSCADSAAEEELTGETPSPETRDYMGEMVLACQLMITGGEPKELAAMTRQDRLFMVNALTRAARDAISQGHSQMVTSDIVRAFRWEADQLVQHPSQSTKALRLQAMADSLDFFCQDALSANIFNRRGDSWPIADITVFEQGTFKDNGYETHNVLSFMGLMGRVMAQAEQSQSDARQTIVFIDEVHTLLKVPLTASYLTKCAKMSRKLGVWWWMATQNIHDFTGEAQKILSMIEFWVCLGLSESEIQALASFRSLSEEEKTLFRAVRKSAKQYVEGVLLCPRLTALFRNIPPRLCLALAMTEKHEKAQRKTLMQEFNLTELQAVKRIAAEMMQH